MAYRIQTINALIGRLDNLPDSAIKGKVAQALGHVRRESNLLWGLKPSADHSDAFNMTVKNNEATKMRDRLVKTRGELSSLTTGYRSEQLAARNLKAQLTDGPFSAEIRVLARGMDSAQRLAFIAEAIKTGDTQVAAAMLNCPALLSGLSTEQSALYREAYLEKYAPDSGADDLRELEMIITTTLNTADSLAVPTSAPVGSTV